MLGIPFTFRESPTTSRLIGSCVPSAWVRFLLLLCLLLRCRVNWLVVGGIESSSSSSRHRPQPQKVFPHNLAQQGKHLAVEACGRCAPH